MKEMKKLLKQKHDFNLIDKKVEIISPIPEFLFAYSYDDKTPEKEQDIIFRKECFRVDPKIQILTLAYGTTKLLAK